MKQLPFWRRPYGVTRVLDVGGGHNPFRGATHVVEIDMMAGHHRDGRALALPQSARLIAGNVEELPFRTGTFDFIYASHVLEHVDAPSRACQELMRVGSRGYIETPSPLLEQGLAFGAQESAHRSFHKWYVFSPDQGRLIFEPKTRDTSTWFCRCPDGQFIHELFDVVDFEHAQHYLRRTAKTTIFHWTHAFRVGVRNEVGHCTEDGIGCRFVGMRKALMANCNDLFRARRLLRFKKTFPDVQTLFRKYGYRTFFIR